MAPKQKDRPFADRMFVLSGILSAYFAIHSVQSVDPEIAGSDQFLAVLFWCFSFFIFVATSPKTEAER